MESFGQIDQLHMSGARAVFTLKEDSKVSKADLEAAFEEQGMELTTFGEEPRPRPKARYKVDAGVT